MSELTKDEVLAKLEDVSKKKVNVNKEISHEGNGLFDLLGRRHIFIRFSLEANENVDLNPDVEPFDYADWEINIPPIANYKRTNTNNFTDFSIDFPKSKYSTALIYQVNDSINNEELDSINYLINQNGIIQLKRADQFGKLEYLGMFVEESVNKNEIIINLNGQTEEHFENIFIPVTSYFLSKGLTVIVDHDIAEPYLVQQNIDEGRNNIYDSIHREMDIVLQVEERRFGDEIHTCVVLTPSYPDNS